MIALLLSTALAAEAQRWTVVGVGKGDTLNLRADARVGAKVLGKLAEGATVEEVEANEDGWFKVRSGATVGWVNGRYLTPMLPTTGKLPTSLSCAGTEPFWSVAIADGKGTYSSPESPTGTAVSVTEQRSTHDAAFLVTASGGGWSWLTVELDADTCSDGMSSRRYPYRALGLLGDQAFVAGCCRVR